MKKILAFLLALTLFAVCGGEIYTYAASADAGMEEENVYDIRVLTALGIMPSEYENRAGETFKRSDAAKVFAGFYPRESGGERIFGDVSPESELGGAVSVLAKYGVIKGSGDGEFNPDAAITAEELSCMAVRALGTERYAGLKGGYPYGYFSVLKSVFKINIQNKKSFKVCEAASFIRKAAECGTVSQSSGGSTSVYDFKEANTLLSVNLGINKAEGIVDSNSVSGLYEKNSKRKNGIKIDGVFYKGGSKNYDDFLGYSVEAYYTGEKDDKTLICVFKNPKKNKELILDSDADYENGEYIYYDGNKEKRVKVGGNNFALIYNGVAAESLAPEAFETKNGRITLVDNQNGGVYNIVKTDDCQSFRVETANAESIAFKDGGGINLDESEKDYVIQRASGEIIGAGDLTDKSVVSVFKSQSGEFVKIVCTDMELTGILKSRKTLFSGDEEWNIDGEVFRANEGFDGSLIRAGMRITAFFDCYNKIVYCEPWDEEYYFYAVLGGVGSQKGIDGGVKLKMYDSDGVVRVISGKETILIDGKKVSGETAIMERLNEALCKLNYYKEVKTLEPDSPAPILQNEGFRQFVRYKMNSDEEVFEIDTAAPWMDDDYSKTLHISALSADNAPRSAGIRLNMLGSSLAYDADTIFFWVNTDSEKDSEFFTEKGGASLMNDVSYNADGFYVNNEIVAEYAVITTSNDDAVPIGDWNRLIVVDEVENLKIEGEDYKKIYYYEGYHGVFRYEAVENSPGVLGDVEKGDIIRISNIGSKISAVEMIYDYSKKKISGTKGDYFAYPHIMAGEVYSMRGNLIAVTTQEPALGGLKSDSCYIYNTSEFPIIKISEGKEINISVGSAADIKSYVNFGNECSRVFVHMVGGSPITIIVIQK